MEHKRKPRKRYPHIKSIDLEIKVQRQFNEEEIVFSTNAAGAIRMLVQKYEH